MKKIFTIVAMTFLWFMSLSAQVPQKLTYQSVIRDAAGNVINNQDLEVQITILQGSIEGPVVYSENHSTATTVNGVITLEVGGGKTSYDFTSIDWSDGPYYIRSTAELNGKSISVTSQLLSVPYSLYAHRAFLADKVNEQFLEDIIAAKIQSALEEQNVAWEDKIQKALDERDAIWQGKLEALEAVLDSITAQQATPVDTIPSDTIPSDTIPSDTTVAPVDTIPADTVNVDTAIKSAAVHGVLPGKFSMGEDYQVHFSKGMLQYLAYKNVWRFAKNQFDVIDKSYSDYWMYPAEGWVDKYQHGAGTVDKPECDYYVIDYTYWGIHYPYTADAQKAGFNPIHNGGNKERTWATPSTSNWKYLFSFRDRADSLYSKAEVVGIKGYVILPDDWKAPSDLTFKPKSENCSDNVYDKKTWEKMEALGAVFMPFTDYWSWHEWGDQEECVFIRLKEDRGYISCEDVYYCENDITYDFANGTVPKGYRLVVSDSVANVIMNGEAIENEDLDGLEVNRPNNYLPESNPDLSGVDMKAGLLNGKFSVSENKQVNFSQGNLLYHGKSKTWRFTEKQYKYSVSQAPDDTTHKEWGDQFRWAASGYACDPRQDFSYGSFGTNTTGLTDISGTKYDWGVNNPIINGGNKPNLWRTLTTEEWEYLMNRRKDGRLLNNPARVCGTDGILLLPDDWDLDSNLLSADTTNPYVYNYSTYNITDSIWSIMEAKGAVFLPSWGITRFNTTYDIDDLGYTSWIEGAYWTATSANIVYINVDSSEARENTYWEDRDSYIYHVSVKFNTNGDNYPACSVRLVRDVTE